MLDATFARPDLTTFCRLEGLGLLVTGQRLEPDRAVLACRVADPDPWCRRCGCEGAPRDSVTRTLAHEPLGCLGGLTYFGGPSARNARRTAFRDTPRVLAITLIGIPSARCNRRISAQSSTFITPQASRRGSIFVRRCGVRFHPSLTPAFSDLQRFDYVSRRCSTCIFSSLTSGQTAPRVASPGHADRAITL
jgi:hypothetical protein